MITFMVANANHFKTHYLTLKMESQFNILHDLHRAAL